MHFLTHIRIVSALLIREMSTRFGNKPGGYIWALLDPVAHVLMLTILFQAIAHVPPLGSNFTLFFATGYIAFHFYQGTMKYMSEALQANKSLLSYPNVAPIDTLIARLILQIFTMILVGFIILTVSVHYSRMRYGVDWGYVFISMVAAAALATGVSLSNTVLFLKSPLYEKVYQIAMKPAFMLAGVFYLPDALPHPFREIIGYNPVVHLVALFRKGFYPEYRAVILDVGYLSGWIFVSLLGGMTLFTLSARALRSR